MKKKRVSRLLSMMLVVSLVLFMGRMFVAQQFNQLSQMGPVCRRWRRRLRP